eukprot:scaffold107_cov269-Chaetoceros_neogracile.AAC.36
MTSVNEVINVSHDAEFTSQKISHEAISTSGISSDDSDQNSPNSADNTPAPSKPITSLYDDAIDVLQMASSMKILSEQTSSSSVDIIKIEDLAWVPADPQNINNTKITPVPPQTKPSLDQAEETSHKIDVGVGLSQMSQVSSEEKMIKRYDCAGITNEVIGVGSKLSQELDYNESEHNAEPAVSFSQADAQEPEFSFSQGADSPSPDLQQSFSQLHPEQSQQYFMSTLSQSSLPISQPYSNQYEGNNQAVASSTTAHIPALASMKGPILTDQDRQTLKVKSSITQNVIRKTNQKKRFFDESLAKDKKLPGDIPPPEKYVKTSTSASGARRPTSYKPRKSIEQKTKEEAEVNYTANRAVELIDHLASNRKVEKQILLSMALTRTSPRIGPPQLPPHGSKLAAGFQWSQFPPLEKLLRSHMEEYYELSIEVCQSILQQEFNNKLVHKVQEMATFYGWEFAFTFKALRDRVRCYFKTHIQNAKKRLKTMTKNPTKKANAKALASHLDLLEMHEETKIDIQFKEDFKSVRGTALFQKAEGVDADDNDEDAATILGGFRQS